MSLYPRTGKRGAGVKRSQLLAEIHVTRPTTCSAKGCDHVPYCRGLCSGHYRRLMVTGDLHVDKPVRIAKYTTEKCAECKKRKPYARNLCWRCYERQRSQAAR